MSSAAKPPDTRPLPARRAAFFDMDRTLLRVDSGMSWMKYLRRRGEISAMAIGRAVYWSMLYKLALLDLEALATRLSADLKGDTEAEMLAKARDWYELHVAHQVSSRARDTVERHRAAGDVVVILTGATQFVAEPVAASLGVEHTLCSRLEISEGVLTGRLSQMCFGHHKVPIAEALAHAEDLDLESSVFYSDSYNDMPMLRRVGEAVAVNPDARLRRTAQRAGWRIERWA